ncbi:unnamed protein product [Pleuronectes platessa]|uniref:Ig-like domain-containing protein n=1 Tax=Pleuronectes platessa TaxID=8262 RepID=A0A9N7UN71_PLEPL|nr:unnamed protein product [Pleuronectes platessa]
MVEQRTQERPWVYPLKLSVEYPPSVSIEGYDNNWYVGRSDAVLQCLASGNPVPTTLTWTTASGSLPDTVVVDGNKLLVRKVDDAVNTTFICEVKNKHGTSSHQITTIVIGLIWELLGRWFLLIFTLDYVSMFASSLSDSERWTLLIDPTAGPHCTRHRANSRSL